MPQQFTLLYWSQPAHGLTFSFSSFCSSSNHRTNHPEISSNHDTMTLIIGILREKYHSNQRATELVKNSWNAVNRLLKSEMSQYATSLIQDWMLREQIEAQHQDGSVTVDYKLKCGLNIRISDKRVLWSAWVQMQRLRKLLLSLLRDKPWMLSCSIPMRNVVYLIQTHNDNRANRI